MSNKTTAYLTQLDYIKILLEEQRIGEASDLLNELNTTIKINCKEEAEKLNNATEIEIKQSIKNTKPNNWVFVNNIWAKLLSVSRNEIQLEIAKDIEVKLKIK